MRQPLQISFQDIAPSPAVEVRIREKVNHLEKLFQRLISCRVTLGETSHKPNPRSSSFFCHIDLRLPGKEIAIARSTDRAELMDHRKKSAKDIYVAIREAFEDAERALREHTQRIIQSKRRAA